MVRKKPRTCSFSPFGVQAVTLYRKALCMLFMYRHYLTLRCAMYCAVPSLCSIYFVVGSANGILSKPKIIRLWLQIVEEIHGCMITNSVPPH